MKTLFILNDAPYGSERTYNGLRLAGAVTRQEGSAVRVFLIGDGASSAHRNQKVPQGFYNVEVMIGNVIRNGGEVGICGTCMDARGMVSFFAWFLYFYLRYRTDQPKHLVPAVVFAALSFYSYNGGQLGIVIMGLLLLVFDWRYHLQERRIALIALGAAIVCALPYLRFQITHGAEVSAHLQLLGSYWTQDLPLSEKLYRAVQEYAYGLRPDYWFAPDNPRDQVRHQLKGYGNLLWVTLPFLVLGLIVVVKNAFRGIYPAHIRCSTGASVGRLASTSARSVHAVSPLKAGRRARRDKIQEKRQQLLRLF